MTLLQVIGSAVIVGIILWLFMFDGAEFLFYRGRKKRAELIFGRKGLAVDSLRYWEIERPLESLNVTQIVSPVSIFNKPIYSGFTAVQVFQRTNKGHFFGIFKHNQDASFTGEEWLYLDLYLFGYAVLSHPMKSEIVYRDSALPEENRNTSLLNQDQVITLDKLKSIAADRFSFCVIDSIFFLKCPFFLLDSELETFVNCFLDLADSFETSDTVGA